MSPLSVKWEYATVLPSIFLWKKQVNLLIIFNKLAIPQYGCGRLFFAANLLMSLFQWIGILKQCFLEFQQSCICSLVITKCSSNWCHIHLKVNEAVTKSKSKKIQWPPTGCHSEHNFLDCNSVRERFKPTKPSKFSDHQIDVIVNTTFWTVILLEKALSRKNSKFNDLQIDVVVNTNFWTQNSVRETFKPKTKQIQWPPNGCHSERQLCRTKFSNKGSFENKAQKFSTVYDPISLRIPSTSRTDKIIFLTC